MTAPLLAFEDVPLPGSGTLITLSVPPHNAVIVIGPEASGVDVLPSLALALMKPRAGRVLLFGEEIAQLPYRSLLAFRRRVGYLPADDGLLHNLTLGDNVALPLRYGSDLSEHEIRGRLSVMFAMLGIGDAARLRPADATDEQRRRAAIARALAFDPQLLILADPFDGLTIRAASELLDVARGGETGEGARRAVFITGQHIPARLEPRIETRYRLAKGELLTDN
jgi:ABC-type transporter Mla maintaining outer membrane lipid asymmetry ATPase subunit MlaF